MVSKRSVIDHQINEDQLAALHTPGLVDGAGHRVYRVDPRVRYDGEDVFRGLLWRSPAKPLSTMTMRRALARALPGIVARARRAQVHLPDTARRYPAALFAGLTVAQIAARLADSTQSGEDILRALPPELFYRLIADAFGVPVVVMRVNGTMATYQPRLPMPSAPAGTIRLVEVGRPRNAVLPLTEGSQPKPLVLAPPPKSSTDQASEAQVLAQWRELVRRGKATGAQLTLFLDRYLAAQERTGVPRALDPTNQTEAEAEARSRALLAALTVLSEHAAGRLTSDAERMLRDTRDRLTEPPPRSFEIRAHPVVPTFDQAATMLTALQQEAVRAMTRAVQDVGPTWNHMFVSFYYGAGPGLVRDVLTRNGLPYSIQGMRTLVTTTLQRLLAEDPGLATKVTNTYSVTHPDTTLAQAIEDIERPKRHDGPGEDLVPQLLGVAFGVDIHFIDLTGVVRYLEQWGQSPIPNPTRPRCYLIRRTEPGGYYWMAVVPAFGSHVPWQPGMVRPALSLPSGQLPPMWADVLAEALTDAVQRKLGRYFTPENTVTAAHLIARIQPDVHASAEAVALLSTPALPIIMSGALVDATLEGLRELLPALGREYRLELTIKYGRATPVYRVYPVYRWGAAPETAPDTVLALMYDTAAGWSTSVVARAMAPASVGGQRADRSSGGDVVPSPSGPGAVRPVNTRPPRGKPGDAGAQDDAVPAVGGQQGGADRWDGGRERDVGEFFNRLAAYLTAIGQPADDAALGPVSRAQARAFQSSNRQVPQWVREVTEPRVHALLVQVLAIPALAATELTENGVRLLRMRAMLTGVPEWEAGVFLNQLAAHLTAIGQPADDAALGRVLWLQAKAYQDSDQPAPPVPRWVSEVPYADERALLRRVLAIPVLAAVGLRENQVALLRRLGSELTEVQEREVGIFLNRLAAYRTYTGESAGDAALGRVLWLQAKAYQDPDQPTPSLPLWVGQVADPVERALLVRVLAIPALVVELHESRVRALRRLGSLRAEQEPEVGEFLNRFVAYLTAIGQPVDDGVLVRLLWDQARAFQAPDRQVPPWVGEVRDLSERALLERVLAIPTLAAAELRESRVVVLRGRAPLTEAQEREVGVFLNRFVAYLTAIGQPVDDGVLVRLLSDQARAFQARDRRVPRWVGAVSDADERALLERVLAIPALAAAELQESRVVVLRGLGLVLTEAQEREVGTFLNRLAVHRARAGEPADDAVMGEVLWQQALSYQDRNRPLPLVPRWISAVSNPVERDLLQRVLAIPALAAVTLPVSRVAVLRGLELVLTDAQEREVADFLNRFATHLTATGQPVDDALVGEALWEQALAYQDQGRSVPPLPPWVDEVPDADERALLERVLAIPSLAAAKLPANRVGVLRGRGTKLTEAQEGELRAFVNQLALHRAEAGHKSAGVLLWQSAKAFQDPSHPVPPLPRWIGEMVDLDMRALLERVLAIPSLADAQLSYDRLPMLRSRAGGLRTAEEQEVAAFLDRFVAYLTATGQPAADAVVGQLLWEQAKAYQDPSHSVSPVPRWISEVSDPVERVLLKRVLAIPSLADAQLAEPRVKVLRIRGVLTEVQERQVGEFLDRLAAYRFLAEESVADLTVGQVLWEQAKAYQDPSHSAPPVPRWISEVSDPVERASLERVLAIPALAVAGLPRNRVELLRGQGARLTNVQEGEVAVFLNLFAAHLTAMGRSAGDAALGQSLWEQALAYQNQRRPAPRWVRETPDPDVRALLERVLAIKTLATAKLHAGRVAILRGRGLVLTQMQESEVGVFLRHLKAHLTAAGQPASDVSLGKALWEQALAYRDRGQVPRWISAVVDADVRALLERVLAIRALAAATLTKSRVRVVRERQAAAPPGHEPARRSEPDLVVPADVVAWEPILGQGPQTLVEFLESHPVYGTLVQFTRSLGTANRRSLLTHPLTAAYVTAWIEARQDRPNPLKPGRTYTTQDVADQAGSALDPDHLATGPVALTSRFAVTKHWEEDQPFEVPADVVNWEPILGQGPKTLVEFLESHQVYRTRVHFSRDGNGGLDHPLTIEYVEAWAKARQGRRNPMKELHTYTMADVFAQAGMAVNPNNGTARYLMSYNKVKRLWQREKQPSEVVSAAAPATAGEPRAAVPAGADSAQTRYVVPGDGNCILYSIMSTAPDRVIATLAELLTREQVDWLSDPDRVRADLARLARTHPDDRPDDASPALDVVAAMRTRIGHYLDEHVAVGLPADLVRQLGGDLRARIQQSVITTAGDEQLRHMLAGYTTVSGGADDDGDGAVLLALAGVVPLRALRAQYVVAVAEGLRDVDPVTARARARAQVPLHYRADAERYRRANGDDSDLSLVDDDDLIEPYVAWLLTQPPPAGMTVPQYHQRIQDRSEALAEESVSPVRMVRTLGVDAVLAGIHEPAVLRAVLRAVVGMPQVAVTRAEITALQAMVWLWDQLWPEDVGDAFVPLAAYAFGLRAAVHTPGGVVHELGPVDGAAVRLYRSGLHYEGMPSAPADETARKRQLPPTENDPGDLSDTGNPRKRVRHTAPPPPTLAVNTRKRPAPQPDSPTGVESGHTRKRRPLELETIFTQQDLWRQKPVDKGAPQRSDTEMTEVRGRKLIPTDRVPTLPWLDPLDPLNSVYHKFAGRDGKVAPDIVALVDKITVKHVMYKEDPLQTAASSLRDSRLPTTVVDDLPERYESMAEDVKAMLQARIRGEPLPSRVRAELMPDDHLAAHEWIMKGTYGAYFETGVDESGRPRPVWEVPEADRPTVVNGKVLGIYDAAVLENAAQEDQWKKQHPQYPEYAMQVDLPNGENVTMTAEGAAAPVAFANTVLRRRTIDPRTGEYRPLALDRSPSGINALFLPFEVTFPRGNGELHKMTVMVLVAFPTAFVKEYNPFGLVRADYGVDFVKGNLDPTLITVKNEPVEPAPGLGDVPADTIVVDLRQHKSAAANSGEAAAQPLAPQPLAPRPPEAEATKVPSWDELVRLAEAARRQREQDTAQRWDMWEQQARAATEQADRAREQLRVAIRRHQQSTAKLTQAHEGKQARARVMQLGAEQAEARAQEDAARALVREHEWSEKRAWGWLRSAGAVRKPWHGSPTLGRPMFATAPPGRARTVADWLVQAADEEELIAVGDQPPPTGQLQVIFTPSLARAAPPPSTGSAVVWAAELADGLRVVDELPPIPGAPTRVVVGSIPATGPLDSAAVTRFVQGYTTAAVDTMPEQFRDGEQNRLAQIRAWRLLVATPSIAARLDQSAFELAHGNLAGLNAPVPAKEKRDVWIGEMVLPSFPLPVETVDPAVAQQVARYLRRHRLGTGKARWRSWLARRPTPSSADLATITAGLTAVATFGQTGVHQDPDRIDTGLRMLPRHRAGVVFAADLPTDLDPSLLDLDTQITLTAPLLATSDRAQALTRAPRTAAPVSRPESGRATPIAPGDIVLARITTPQAHTARPLLAQLDGSTVYGANTVVIGTGRTFRVTHIELDTGHSPGRRVWTVQLNEITPPSTTSPGTPPTKPTPPSAMAGAPARSDEIAPGVRQRGALYYFTNADHTPADHAAAHWWSRLRGVIPVVLHSDPVAAVVRVGDEWIDYPQFAARLADHLARHPHLAGLPILLIDCRGAARLQHATELAAEIRHRTGHRVLATTGNITQGVPRVINGSRRQIVLTQHFALDADYRPVIHLPTPTEPLDPNRPPWIAYNLDGTTTVLGTDLVEVLREHSLDPADADRLTNLNLETPITWTR